MPLLRKRNTAIHAVYEEGCRCGLYRQSRIRVLSMHPIVLELVVLIALSSLPVAFVLFMLRSPALYLPQCALSYVHIYVSSLVFSFATSGFARKVEQSSVRWSLEILIPLSTQD